MPRIQRTHTLTHIFRTFYFIDSLCGWIVRNARYTNKQTQCTTSDDYPSSYMYIKFGKTLSNALLPHRSRFSRKFVEINVDAACLCWSERGREFRSCVCVCIWAIVCFVLYKLCCDDVASSPPMTRPRPAIQPDFQLPLCWRLCLFSLLSAFNYMHLYALVLAFIQNSSLSLMGKKQLSHFKLARIYFVERLSIPFYSLLHAHIPKHKQRTPGGQAGGRSV